MKKMVLVARKDRISVTSHLVLDDFARRALDDIIFGKVKELEDSADPMSFWEELGLDFERDHPDFHADRYSIQLENSREIDCSEN